MWVELMGSKAQPRFVLLCTQSVSYTSHWAFISKLLDFIAQRHYSHAFEFLTLIYLPRVTSVRPCSFALHLKM